MAASLLRRWGAAGHKLQQCDRVRLQALLEIAEGYVRAHQSTRQLAERRSRRFAAGVRKVMLAGLMLVASCGQVGASLGALASQPDDARAVDRAPVVPDAPSLPPDAPSAPLDAPVPLCLTSALLGSTVCLERAPTAPVVLGPSIDTDGSCTVVLAQPVGPSLCIIAGSSIDVPRSATVRATGASALALVAVGAITIRGVLDARQLAGRPVPGARSMASCTPPGAAGLIDAFSPAYNRAGAGGGAGGSRQPNNPQGSVGIGAFGGIGGNPVDGVNWGRGMPLFVDVAPGVLAGGCPGGKGGDVALASGNGGGGAGGSGGAAVYLLSMASIAVSGTVHASGSDGGAGVPGDTGNASGGGGGGSGGTIALDAPRIDVTGSLVADGGRGGDGGAVPPLVGGAGGAGGAPAVAPIAGGNGQAGIIGPGLPGSGGGGGGGGPGAIIMLVGDQGVR